ncbi:MAG: hypothetical protein ACP5O0_01890 [Acidimicrobiales bacterium]
MTSNKWPANAVTDIHSLNSAVGAFVGGLKAEASLGSSNVTTWEIGLAQDESALSTAVGRVAADLGISQNG